MADQIDDKEKQGLEEDRLNQGEEIESFATEENVWHEEQPPADGFEDQDLTDETVEAAEAAVEDEDGRPIDDEEGEEGEEPDEDENDDDEVAPPPQKKSQLIPIVAGVGGALFVALMMYVQFGVTPGVKGSSQPMSEVLGQSDAAPVTAKAATPLPPVAPSQGKIDSLSTLSDIGPGSVASSLPPVENSTVSEPLTNTPDLLASPSAAAVAPKPTPVAAPAPIPAPVAAAPAVLPAPVVAPAPVVPAAPAAAPVQAPAAVFDVAKPATAENSVAVTALAGRVDALQKSIDQVNKQIAQLGGTLSNVQAALAMPSSAASAGPDPVLLDRLAKVEQQLAAKKAVVSSVPTVAPTKAAVVNDSVVSDEPRASTKASAHKSRAEKRAEKRAAAAAKKKGGKTASRAEKAESAVSETSPKASKAWVLRAATPDSAWVAKSAEATELRQIEVGQSLPGIGTVKAIRSTESGWEIVGTSGSIR